MKFRITTVAAAGLALSAAAAFAQTPSKPQGVIGGYQQSSTTTPGWSLGNGSAQVMPGPYIGGYGNSPGPYYNGTGSAQVVPQAYIGGYGNSPGPYYNGTGSAQASNTPQAYIGGYGNSPGPYYNGTGTVQKGPQYNQGSAQSLSPSPAQGVFEQTGGNTQQK